MKEDLERMKGTWFIVGILLETQRNITKGLGKAGDPADIRIDHHKNT
jgi:hypothetical protein